MGHFVVDLCVLWVTNATKNWGCWGETYHRCYTGRILVNVYIIINLLGILKII